MDKVERQVSRLHRLATSFLDRKAFVPPELTFKRTSNGKKIYDYHKITADEVLQDQKTHRRILVDWETNHELVRHSYCPLELRSFLDFPYRQYQFTTRDEELFSSTLPQNLTEDEFKTLMFSWFSFFDSWFFGSTLSGTKLVVKNASSDGNFEGNVQNGN